MSCSHAVWVEGKQRGTKGGEPNCVQPIQGYSLPRLMFSRPYVGIPSFVLKKKVSQFTHKKRGITPLFVWFYTYYGIKGKFFPG
jgi:hypothetical protein